MKDIIKKVNINNIKINQHDLIHEWGIYGGGINNGYRYTDGSGIGNGRSIFR
jgi:hypothetical protein